MDCEGCWINFVKSHKEKFRNQVDKIILGKNVLHFQSNKIHFKSSENDHPEEEATRKGLAILKEIGFSVNEKLTTGNILWIGSMFALTKEKSRIHFEPLTRRPI